ncbi:targeting protein for Xklp2 homolog [Diachasmimorpha longicaudata]|uniref:targeting protein for Xklp2 homolog n=1 Tax=Diachasmimorpha longicaudata TaxID=58733 RepID=UPI0030B903C6
MESNLKFNSPYSADAPMWSDFGSSPNVSSEYFEVLHPENETPFIELPEKMRLNRSDIDSSSVVTMQTGFLLPPGSSQSNSTFMDAIDTINMTPVKVISPKGKSGQPKVVKETTVEDIMNNVIEIASTVTKQTRRVGNLNKTPGAPSQKTPEKSKRITRSMHLTEGVKTETSLAQNSGSTTRRSVAAQKLSTSTKTIEVVDSSVKNEARVPPSKIIRTPIFNYKKTPVIESLEDMNELASTRLSTQQVDTHKTLKPGVNDNAAQQQQQHMKDCSKMTTSTLAPNPSLTVSMSKLRKSVLASNNSKQQIPASTVLKQVQPQEVPPTVPYQSSETGHPEEDNDEHYEEIEQEGFESVGHSDYYPVHRRRVIEKRRMRGTQPSVLTSHARRRSSIIKTHRTSNQYVSLAEAIKKFEKGTPTRFHSVRAKDLKAKPLQVVKQQALKTTIPVSPALMSKNRVRRHVVLSQAELEEIELQKMKQHQIRAKPAPTNILKAPQPLKSVPKKPLTAQKPFHLTKPQNSAPAKQGSTSSLSSVASGHHVQLKKPVKNIVPTIVNSDGGVTIAETQIIHFGIPISEKSQVIGSAKKKTTRPLPFNFEARNKLFTTKEEEKLKKLQSKEGEKVKVEFRARPMPLTTKKYPLQPSKQGKGQAQNHTDDGQDKHKVKINPFSFEARDKGLMKKKEQLQKKIEEEEKKARTFHANPAPHFKPVQVRGRSRENHKIDNNNPGTIRIRSAESRQTDVKLQPRGRSVENLRTRPHDKSKHTEKVLGSKSMLQIPTPTYQLSGETDNNQENRSPNCQAAVSRGKILTKPNMPVLKPKLKSLPAELHSDKRARMRKDFDDQLKMKAALKEEKRRREQEERLAREQREIKELRKKAETKARPMPVYKPMTLIKSTKQLTTPESPAWAKSKH